MLERPLAMVPLRIITCTTLSCWEPSELVTGEGVSPCCSYTVLVSDFCFVVGDERFSMIKHPKLMEICKERKIALEVCPISFVFFFIRISMR